MNENAGGALPVRRRSGGAPRSRSAESQGATQISWIQAQISPNDGMPCVGLRRQLSGRFMRSNRVGAICALIQLICVAPCFCFQPPGRPSIASLVAAGRETGCASSTAPFVDSAVESRTLSCHRRRRVPAIQVVQSRAPEKIVQAVNFFARVNLLFAVCCQGLASTRLSGLQRG